MFSGSTTHNDYIAQQILNFKPKTPFAELLIAVFNSILQVFLLCTAGYILARNGILDKRTQKQINRLNVSLFTPALLFSKVAFYLTPEKLKELWIIPIWFIIVTGASMAVGKFLGWAFKLRSSQRSFVTAASMFMNSNALPIALMQSLVSSIPNDLTWGPDDNQNAMLGRALTYLAMYSTLGMVVRYSYGVSLLARADTLSVEPEPQAHHGMESGDDETPLLFGSPTPTPTLRVFPKIPSQTTLIASSSTASSPRMQGPSSLPQLRPSPIRRKTTFYNSFPNSPNQSRTDLNTSSDPSDVEDEDGDLDIVLPLHSSMEDAQPLVDIEANPRPAVAHHHQHRHPVLRYISQILCTIYNFMTVPLWSALFSLIIACVEPLQHALENHMKPVEEAINTAGRCAVPLTLVVLGAYFVKSEEGQEGAQEGRNMNSTSNGHANPSASRSIITDNWTKKHKRKPPFFRRVLETLHLTKDKNPSSTHKKPPKMKPGETKIIILAIFSRMIITPMLLIPFIVLSTKSDWHAVFEDPIFITVNTILLTSPPALTLAQITAAAASGEAFEKLISRTIFWSYCIVTPPVMIGCVVLGIWLVGL